jgi:sulfotransferase
MNKTYNFMAGLPRSGSTVLSALLNQHPDLYSSPQTDLLELLYTLDAKIPNLESYKAELLFSSYKNVMKSLPGNFYEPINKRVIIDKNRGWGTPYNWNNLSPYLNPDGKVILTMRPILEVLASFLKVAEKTKKQTGQDAYYNPDLWVSDYRSVADAQIENLMTLNGEVERAILSAANLLKNHGNRVFVVWFDDLLDNPQQTLNGIYDFLEIDRFENNFQSITQVDEHQDLAGYGLVGLHDVGPRLERPDTKITDYLSDYIIGKYKNALDFLWV